MRFLSFNSDWHKYKFSDLFSYRQERKKDQELPIASATQEKGMVIRSENGIDIKYKDSSTAAYKVVYGGDYVIHLRSFQGGYAFSEIKCACSPAYIILKPNDKLCYSFLKSFFTSKKFINSLRDVTYGIRDGKTISHDEWIKKAISLPSIPEQQKIVLFLDLIERRIDVQNKIIEELKNLEKSLIDTVFSQEPSTTLASFIFETSERNRSRQVALVYSVSNKLGFIPQSEQFEDKEVASSDKENYKIVRKKTFAYNPARINVGSIGYYDGEEAVIISPMYVCFKADGIDETALQQFFLSRAFYREMGSKLEGSVRQCLTFEGMKSIRIHLPNQGETKQLKLAQLIRKKRRNEEVILASLSKQKASLLARMFI